METITVNIPKHLSEAMKNMEGTNWNRVAQSAFEHAVEKNQCEEMVFGPASEAIAISPNTNLDRDIPHRFRFWKSSAPRKEGTEWILGVSM
ncbi:MAG: hypothetical protein HQL75_08235 [Magnetococcales bacterium]|nr:hypothetical protein [Magnetococcales bacterium]